MGFNIYGEANGVGDPTGIHSGLRGNPRGQFGQFAWKIACLILGICSIAAVNINFTESYGDNGLYDLFYSFSSYGLANGLFAAMLGYYYYRIHAKYRPSNATAFFTLFLAFLMLIGMCFISSDISKTGISYIFFSGPVQLLKSLVVLTGYGSLFYSLLIILQEKISYLREDHSVLLKRCNSERQRFMAAVLILFVCWLPYLFAFYPGTILYDSVSMLEQYYGYSTLTNHSPVFLTFLYGFFADLGQKLGSATFGIFLLVLLQVIFFDIVIVYGLRFFYRAGVSRVALRGGIGPMHSYRFSRFWSLPLARITVLLS